MKSKISLNILFLILLALFLVVDPFFHKGIFRAHDMPSNLTNLGGFYQSLLEGNIVPRWLGNINNLYGGPAMIFYYPFSYYLASIIRLFGFSLIDTTKLLILITFVISSLMMFFWLKKHLSVLAAFIGAFLYVYAPYRITDIYARGSIAENTAFMFVPLIAYQIYLLIYKPTIRKVILLALLIAAFILSHLFLVVVFTPFFILYLIYLSPKREKLVLILVSVCLAVSFTSFYLIPLFFESKYTHYDISPFNGSEYYTQFLNIKQLVSPNWTFIDQAGNKEYQTYQIGLIQIILVLFSFMIIFFKLKGITSVKMRFYLLGLILFCLSIFLMLPISNFIYKIFTPLQKIVFPWRFLALTVFSSSIIAAFLIDIFLYKWQKVIIFLVVLSGLILYLPYAKGHDYQVYTDDHFLYDIEITTDGFVTLPKWAAQPDIYSKIYERYQIIEGKAVLIPLLRTSTKHIYKINAEVDSRIADATFYFPGWKVFFG